MKNSSYCTEKLIADHDESMHEKLTISSQNLQKIDSRNGNGSLLRQSNNNK